MSEESNQAHHFHLRTRSGFLWTRILNIPFWALFNMLPIILYKDLDATSFQVTAMIALKPLSSLFSPYWSLLVNHGQNRLVQNLVWANILKFLPFLFFPWFENNWWFIFSFGFYMILSRGVIPAWMEIFKLNIRGVSRERVFALGTVVDYLGCALLPLAFGWLLDEDIQYWRWLFVINAVIGIISTIFLFRIHVPKENLIATSNSEPIIFNKDQLLKPWVESWNLLKERADFAYYQLGFMLCGSGLILIQAVQPMYFVDNLHLNYTEISFAIIVCKGIGFAVTTPLWVRWFQKINIFQFCSWVTVCAGLFPIIMLLAKVDLVWLYVSYLGYGMMQAGSELSWNMSGPIFAQDKDSSEYTRVNLLTVGLRGCFAPLMANLIYTYTNSVTVLIISALLCFIATERFRYFGKVHYAKEGA